MNSPFFQASALIEKVPTTDYCWLDTEDGPIKLWFAKGGTLVWFNINGNRVGGVASKELEHATKQLSKVKVAPFGGKL